MSSNGWLESYSNENNSFCIHPSYITLRIFFTNAKPASLRCYMPCQRWNSKIIKLEYIAAVRVFFMHNTQVLEKHTNCTYNTNCDAVMCVQHFILILLMARGPEVPFLGQHAMLEGQPINYEMGPLLQDTSTEFHWTAYLPSIPVGSCSHAL